MSESLNYELVRDRLIKTRKRRGLSLRQVTDETGLSAATLSRFEQKRSTPDLATVEVLVKWLELDRSAVFNAPEEETPDTPSAVRAHLRADKNLDPLAVEALAKSFDLLYENFARNASR